MYIENLNITNIRNSDNKNEILFDIKDNSYVITYSRNKKGKPFPTGLFHGKDRNCKFCSKNLDSPRLTPKVCIEMPVKIDDLFEEFKNHKNTRLVIISS